jgi:hypothetical protein
MKESIFHLSSDICHLPLIVERAPSTGMSK